MLAEPRELISQVHDLLSLRKEAAINEYPLIIWEPKPSSCKPDNLKEFSEALQYVHVFSPNHIEIAGLFGQSLPRASEESEIERMTRSLCGADTSGQGKVIVVRAGEYGCFVSPVSQEPKWLPAYYQPPKVIGEPDGDSLISERG